MDYKEPLLSVPTANHSPNNTSHCHERQPTFSKLASELSTMSRKYNYGDIASAMSEFSSFIPNQKTDLIQIEYEVHEKSINIKYRILYTTTITLFIIFYVLLFIESTKNIAQYIILFISLALSLIYTMIPSCIRIPIPWLCDKVDDDEIFSNPNKQQTYNIVFKKKRIPLCQWSVPPLCVGLLIASQKFSYMSAYKAIIGPQYPKGILPWNVLGVLFGLCYLCITLDLTGILKALATKTSCSAEPYPLKLFVYIFIFAAILTIVTNNDISIICLTPLVISIANSANMDTNPFIFLVLFASNTFSMLLVTGNPANMIVAGSADLNYIEYVKVMALPTIITGIVLLFELYLMFGNKLKTEYKCNNETNNWREFIKLPKYSIFCGIRLLITVLLLLIVTFIKPLESIPGHDMYIVLGIAIISMIIDCLVFDIRRCVKISANEEELNIKSLIHASKLGSVPEEDSDDEQYNNNPINSLIIQESQSIKPSETDLEMDELSAIKSKSIENDTQTRIIHDSFYTYDSNRLLYNRQKIKIMSFAIDAIWELPWGLIPFVLSLFIMVQFMNDIGLVAHLSEILIKITYNNEWIAMFIIAFISTFLCQCVNNQPMTVLLSAVLSHAKNDISFNNCCSNSAYFALAIGANLGGNGTPIASLAVLIWKSILEKWGLSISYIAFSKRGLIVTPLLVVVCVVTAKLMYAFLH
eukprot:511893_1